MLFLIFSLGADRYAIDVNDIREILPMPVLKHLPGAPAWVAGVAVDAEGTYPVIDLAAMALSRPSRRVLSTRLAVVDYPVRLLPDAPHGMSAPAVSATATATQRLGVILERATSTQRAQASDFLPTGIVTPESPYLGPVWHGRDGMVQHIRIPDLLTSEVRARLFAEPV